MKHVMTLLFLIMFLPLGALQAQDSKEPDVKKGNITVLLSGLENDKGNVKLCLCRSEDEQRGKTEEFYRAVTDSKDRKASWVFSNIPYGRYSIKAFHDVNANSKLDTNFVGMPVELYGFSNNARGRFGPPSFEQAAFTLSAPQMTMALELK